MDEFDLTFAVLVKGVFMGMKHAAPALRSNGGGSIVNTASIAAIQGGYSPHAYAGAKRRLSNDQVGCSGTRRRQHPGELHLSWPHRDPAGGQHGGRPTNL